MNIVNKVMRNVVVGAAVCATALASVGAGAASAGEIKGTYQNPTKGTLEYVAGSEGAPLKGRSHCAYSGLDEPDNIEGADDGDDFLFDQAQSYGQIVRAFGGGPGGASSGCNPNAGFEE